MEQQNSKQRRLNLSFVEKGHFAMAMVDLIMMAAKLMTFHHWISKDVVKHN